MKHNLSAFFVYAVALVLGFVLMGFEMLGSRYLTPYFGSGIETWAALISTVLFAMMCGYFVGGWLADRHPSRRLLAQIIGGAGVYMLFFSRIADPALLFIMERIDDGALGNILASVLMLFVPIALLGTYSPFAVRLLLTDVAESGRTSGMVYGISTLGNVLGTLLTALYLIPLAGSRSLTLAFAALTCLSAVALWVSQRRSATAAIPLALLCLALARPAPVMAGAPAIAVAPDAQYPEGPLWDRGSLYYAEMRRDRVMVWASGNAPRVFWAEAGCGPTSIARYRDGFLVLCHLSARLILVAEDGTTRARIERDEAGRRLTDPNDSISDGLGGVYLTDPGAFSLSAEPSGVLYHLDVAGTLHQVAEGLRYPNGVAVGDGGDVLYLSEHLGRRILAFPISAPGRLGPGREQFRLPAPDGSEALAGPDGIEALPDGAILFAEYGAGRLFRVGADGVAHRLQVGLPYVTNLALDRPTGRLAVTGARSNSEPPYLGAVMILQTRDLDPAWD